MGNTDVRLKHKVQLRRKADEPKLTDENSIENPTPHPTPETPKSKAVIWTVIGIIVLCVIGYFIFSKSDNDGSKSVAVEEISKPEDISTSSDTTNTADTVKEEAGNTETELAENSNSDVSESATPVETAKPAETASTTTANTSTKMVSVSNDVAQIWYIRFNYLAIPILWQLLFHVLF